MMPCATPSAPQSAIRAPSINGVALLGPDEQLAPDELRERAWGELLRQEAVRCGLLPGQAVTNAPELSAQDQDVLDAMLQHEVRVPAPTEDECRRYYDAHSARYVEGRQVHLRHILFAVTEGVDVHALAIRAEQALLQLLAKEAPADLFPQLARELSNCPSGAQGGDVGWIGSEDCAEELANELFLQKNPRHGIGVHPRLVRTRYGLHIIEVLGRRPGRQLTYAEVQPRIALELTQRSRATALHQYIRLLAGRARVEGVTLDAERTPLVQ